MMTNGILISEHFSIYWKLSVHDFTKYQILCQILKYQFEDGINLLCFILIWSSGVFLDFNNSLNAKILGLFNIFTKCFYHFYYGMHMHIRVVVNVYNSV